MLKCMNMNMIYKRLGVLLGGNPEVSLFPSRLTSAWWPLWTACVGMAVPTCALGHRALARSWNSPEEQILDSFQNVPFCHPWISAHKSNFISISSFSSLSSEWGLLVWAPIHSLQRMGAVPWRGRVLGGVQWVREHTCQQMGAHGTLFGDSGGGFWKSAFPIGGWWWGRGEQMHLSQLTEIWAVCNS